MKYNIPKWSVIGVEARIDYTLLVTFVSGEKRVYDMKPSLPKLKGLRKELNNIDFFMKARAEDGGVVWNDDVDIAPETLYYASVPYIDSNDWKNLIDNIIKIRNEKQLSQKDLANLLGVAQSAIAKLEKKTTIPQIDTLMKVVNALGYTLELKPLENE